MSDVLSHHSQRFRPLTGAEKELLAFLISDLPQADEFQTLAEKYEVVDMDDGGMGSIQFREADGRERSFGKVLAESKYVDQDGTLVIISVNTDNYGRLYEVDFWKVDFSPLLKYPTPGDVQVSKS